MENEAPTITCSAQELAFLARVLGSDTLLGVDDPYMGRLADEIEAADLEIRDALAGRRFIQVQPEGGIVMDVGVAALVGACAFPDVSFVASLTPAGKETVERTLHVIPYLAVEQGALPDAPATYRLTALEDAQSVYKRIVELLRLDGQEAAAHGVAARLPEASLVQAREVAGQQGVQAAQNLLRDAGVTGPAAAALAETLAHPVMSGSLVALKRGERAWDVAGVGVLEGANGLWRLRVYSQVQENWVEATACGAEDVCQAVRQAMNRVLAEPLPEA